MDKTPYNITEAKHSFTPGRGDLFVIETEFYENPDHLLNNLVRVDGRTWQVKAMEYVAAHEPFRKNHNYTLKVIHLNEQ